MINYWVKILRISCVKIIALGMVIPLMNMTHVALATFKTKSKECTIKCVNIVSCITHPDDVGGII